MSYSGKCLNIQCGDIEDNVTLCDSIPSCLSVNLKVVDVKKSDDDVEEERLVCGDITDLAGISCGDLLWVHVL
jgi:hypothetical protein